MKRKPDYDVVRRLHGHRMLNKNYRAMLMSIQPGCKVESESTRQGGIVEKVIRNIWGTPVCVKVKCGEHNELTDYISIDRVSMYEPTGDAYRVWEIYTASES